MFWKTKTKTKPQKEIKVNTLTITTDKTRYGWEQGPFTGENKILPWKRFYRWYFGREDSLYFMMKYDKGETLIKREDIVGFNVSITTKMVDV